MSTPPFNPAPVTGPVATAEGTLGGLLTGGLLLVLNNNGITMDDVVMVASAAGGVLGALRYFRGRLRG